MSENSMEHINKKEIGINNVGDLLDACRQNRLVETKGFGLKTQAEIIKSIEFSLSAKGNWHYARLLDLCNAFKADLNSIFTDFQVEFSSDFRRCMPTVNHLLCITTIDLVELVEYLESQEIEAEVNDDEISFLFEGQIPFTMICTDPLTFNRVLFETTGNSEHLKLIGYEQKDSLSFTNEEEFYNITNEVLYSLRNHCYQLSYQHFQIMFYMRALMNE